MSGLWSALLGQVGALWAVSEANMPPPLRDGAPQDIEMQHSIVTLYEEEQQQQPPETEMRAEDFVSAYEAFMRDHYGRQPRFTTDLFCCMVPIAVQVTSGPHDVQVLHRYWWLPEVHPVTTLLVAHNVANFGVVDAGICGTCIIYPDQMIVEWMERIVHMFGDAGIVLETPGPPASPATMAPAQEQPPVANASVIVSKKSD